MESPDRPYVACHIRRNATSGQRRPSRRSPAGSAPRKPPATGTPSAATPPPRKSTGTRSSPPSATPSPAPPGYRQSRPTPELHPKPVTQRYKHVTRAPECLRSLSQHQYCASILRPLPNCALLDQGGAAKRRRGPGPQRSPPALGPPVGARPALAAGAPADQPANRNDRKGRGCEAHAPIGQSLTRTQIVFRRPLPSRSEEHTSELQSLT